MVLLDTCALLWLVNQGKQLSQQAREEIERSVIVYISAISGFEDSTPFNFLVIYNPSYREPLPSRVCVMEESQ